MTDEGIARGRENRISGSTLLTDDEQRVLSAALVEQGRTGLPVRQAYWNDTSREVRQIRNRLLDRMLLAEAGQVGHRVTLDGLFVLKATQPMSISSPHLADCDLLLGVGADVGPLAELFRQRWDKYWDCARISEKARIPGERIAQALAALWDIEPLLEALWDEKTGWPSQVRLREAILDAHSVVDAVRQFGTRADKVFIDNERDDAVTARPEFNASYDGASDEAVGWEAIQRIFDACWTSDWRRLPRYPEVIGGVDAYWIDGAGTKLVAERLDDVRDAYARKESVRIHFVGFKATFIFEPAARTASIMISGPEKSQVEQAISAVRAAFPRQRSVQPAVQSTIKCTGSRWPRYRGQRRRPSRASSFSRHHETRRGRIRRRLEGA